MKKEKFSPKIGEATPPQTVGIYLDEGAKLPTQAYEHDAGHDLYAVEDCIVSPGKMVEVNTGVHLALPPTMYAQVCARSSYGMRGLIVHPGVIDPGYTGNISVFVMYAATPETARTREPYIIKKGDKIAQLVFHNVLHVKLTRISSLPKTERGARATGSSGK